jgi:hypothetical protein
MHVETAEIVTAREPGRVVMRAKVRSKWLTPGTVNTKRQLVIRDSGVINDHQQTVFILRCGDCGYEYGAQGCDVFERKCPRCQGGRGGEGLQDEVTGRV